MTQGLLTSRIQKNKLSSTFANCLNP
jgi:hypothetical protein